MKRDRTRGMRDIPTIQGLRERSMPDTRQQAVTEWARLEHELARLERERETWISNQKRTEERLDQVNQRLARLREMLGLSSEDGRGSGASSRPSTRGDTGHGKEDGRWQEVPLEY